MNKHIKNGFISMLIWILFLVILFGSYTFVTKTPFSYFIDEETGGVISAMFVIVWTFIWFGIGKHYSYDYEIKKQLFLEKYQEINKTNLNKVFKKAYFSQIARILSKVFFVAVPFYIAANIREKPTIINCLFIGTFMAISIILYAYYKKNHIRDITL